MKIDREGFLAAVSALGLLLPALAGCDSTEDAADAGAGGAAAGGEASGGATGGSAAGGAAAGGSAAGGEAAGGAAGGAGGSDVCAGEDPYVGVELDSGENHEIFGQAACAGGTAYKLGLAETASGGAGWYGEDCLPGEKNNFDICHPFAADDGLAGITLTHVATPDLIVPGESSLLSGELAEGITWVIIDADDPSKCWVGGQDVTYYAELNCQTVEQ